MMVAKSHLVSAQFLSNIRIRESLSKDLLVGSVLISDAFILLPQGWSHLSFFTDSLLLLQSLLVGLNHPVGCVNWHLFGPKVRPYRLVKDVQARSGVLITVKVSHSIVKNLVCLLTLRVSWLVPGKRSGVMLNGPVSWALQYFRKLASFLEWEAVVRLRLWLRLGVNLQIAGIDYHFEGILVAV